MVKKNVFLLVMFLLMMVLGNAQAVNMLLNDGFEEGDVGAFDAVTMPGWVVYDPDGTSEHHDYAGRTIDSKAVALRTHSFGDFLYQDVDVTEGEEYVFSVKVRDDSATPMVNQDGVMYVEYWRFDGAWTQLFIGILDRYVFDADPDDEWITLSGSAVAPATTTLARITFALELIGGTASGDLDLDNARIELASEVRPELEADNPWPEHDSPQIASDVNTAGYLEFDLQDSPTITGISYDLYWQVDDANDLYWTNPASGTGAPGDRIFVALPETIAANHIYYWKVDLNITSTDPQEVGLFESPVWWFTTTNNPPVVDAGAVSQNVWMSGGSAVLSLSGSATDDGLPNPPGALANTWSKDSGPGTVVFSPSGDSGVTANAADATATFGSAGHYVLTFEADDTHLTDSDTIEVVVLAEGDDGLVALYGFEGNANDTAPIGGNHHGILSTLNIDDATLPVIDAVDAKVGIGSLQLTLAGQQVHIPDSGVADPNWSEGYPGYNISATWADMQTTNQVTVSAWIKVAPGEFAYSWVSPMYKGEAYAFNRNFDTSNGLFAVGSWTTNDPRDPIIAMDNDAISITLDDGNWHHIAGTYDGAAARFYVDGVLEAQTDDPTYLNSMPVGGGYLQIGNGLNGRIDQARVHDVALSDAMILQQFIDDGGSNSCRQQYLFMDFDQDCHVGLSDFVLFAADWLQCSDVTGCL